MEEKTKEQFIEFLKENGAYESYINNLAGKLNNTLDKVWENETDKKEIIIGSFVYSKTPQNFDYWRKLSQKWGNNV